MATYPKFHIFGEGMTVKEGEEKGWEEMEGEERGRNARGGNERRKELEWPEKPGEKATGEREEM